MVPLLHRILLSNKKKSTTDTCNSLDESPESLWAKKNQSNYILHVSIIWCSLKTNYENGEQIRGSQGVRKRWGRKELSMVVKRQHERSLGWWKCFVSWLSRCRYPGCDIVPHFCKMFLLGKQGRGDARSPCIIPVLFPVLLRMWIYNYHKILKVSLQKQMEFSNTIKA